MSFLDNWEDLSIFTAGEFSDLAAVTSSTAPHTEISGIFDERYESMFPGSIAEGRQITFLVETAKTAGLHHGDRLTIKGNDYLIIEIQPSSDGKLTCLGLKVE